MRSNLMVKNNLRKRSYIKQLTNTDQKSLETVFSIAIRRKSDYKRQSKNACVSSFLLLGQNFFISWFTNPPSVIFREVEKI